jgi:hypothetical protein
LDHGLHVLKPPNHAPKMRERHQLFFGLRLVSKEFQHPTIQTKIEQNFGGFFHQIKMRQHIGRHDSNHDPKKQEDGFIFAGSGSEILLNQRKQKRSMGYVVFALLFKWTHCDTQGPTTHPLPLQTFVRPILIILTSFCDALHSHMLYLPSSVAKSLPFLPLSYFFFVFKLTEI